MSKNYEMYEKDSEVRTAIRNLIRANDIAFHLFVLSNDNIKAVGDLYNIALNVVLGIIQTVVINDDLSDHNPSKLTMLKGLIEILSEKIDVINACETKGPGIVEAIKKLGEKTDAQ